MTDERIAEIELEFRDSQLAVWAEILTALKAERAEVERLREQNSKFADALPEHYWESLEE